MKEIHRQREKIKKFQKKFPKNVKNSRKNVKNIKISRKFRKLQILKDTVKNSEKKQTISKHIMKKFQ